jgi:hypothetical protein
MKQLHYKLLLGYLHVQTVYASMYKVQVMEIDPDDSTLYAKRSLCWLHMGEEDKALDDAYIYRTMKMDLSNCCCEQAAALILVKVS